MKVIYELITENDMKYSGENLSTNEFEKTRRWAEGCMQEMLEDFFNKESSDCSNRIKVICKSITDY